jgi:hypothetical protein
MASKLNIKRSLVLVGVLLFLLPSGVSGGGTLLPTGIQVAMDSKIPLTVRIKLQCGTESNVTLYKSQLPWGSTYSIILVAVTANGQYLKKELPIDDPSPEQITLDPKESIEGSIDLRKVFHNLDEVLKRSDVHLFWAYQAPSQLHIAPAGGWILIPQQE